MQDQNTELPSAALRASLDIFELSLGMVALCMGMQMLWLNSFLPGAKNQTTDYASSMDIVIGDDASHIPITDIGKETDEPDETEAQSANA